MYEICISYVTVNPKNGSDVRKKEYFILEHAESFANAEEIGYDYGSGLTDIDVVAIKRSKLREIVNERPIGDEECKVFFATICDFFTDDNDVTKEIKYTVALFAHDINEAHQAVKQYMLQGLEDMELKQLKETKISDVIR